MHTQEKVQVSPKSVQRFILKSYYIAQNGDGYSY